MKKQFLYFSAFIFICILIVQPACKIVEEAQPATKYILTVIQGEGVSGVPAAGTYNYDENQTVTYSYTATAGYEALDVALDGITIANSGFISMDSNHTLDVTAVFDLTGEWDGYHAEGPNGEGIHYSLHLTFSGGGATGTITCTEGKSWPVTGTYTLNGSAIEFELDSGYKCTGTVEPGKMSGTYTLFPGETGIWILER